MKTYRIATIPGDGIGKEVVPAAGKCCRPGGSLASVHLRELRLGRRLLPPHGEMMPPDGLDAARQGRHPVRLGRRPDIPTTSRCGACA
jgi:tartrate dehydrogenase/decarboxylase/D-malate dehydrogenase